MTNIDVHALPKINIHPGLWASTTAMHFAYLVVARHLPLPHPGLLRRCTWRRLCIIPGNTRRCRRSGMLGVTPHVRLNSSKGDKGVRASVGRGCNGLWALSIRMRFAQAVECLRMTKPWFPSFWVFGMVESTTGRREDERMMVWNMVGVLIVGERLQDFIPHRCLRFMQSLASWWDEWCLWNKHHHLYHSSSGVSPPPNEQPGIRERKKEATHFGFKESIQGDSPRVLQWRFGHAKRQSSDNLSNLDSWWYPKQAELHVGMMMLSLTVCVLQLLQHFQIDLRKGSDQRGNLIAHPCSILRHLMYPSAFRREEYYT